MSIDAMKQALEAMEEIHRTGDTQLFDLCYAPKVIPALRLAIEQAERQAPVLINIELSRRMAAVKVSNFYGSIIRDAEKEIERLHGLVLQHTTPPQRQPLTDEDWAQIWADFEDTDVENDFQDYMVEKYGPGYYVDADGMYWIFQQQVIRRIVDSKLAGEKK
jgi:hypothetical protein